MSWQGLLVRCQWGQLTIPFPPRMSEWMARQQTASAPSAPPVPSAPSVPVAALGRAGTSTDAPADASAAFAHLPPMPPLEPAFTPHSIAEPISRAPNHPSPQINKITNGSPVAAIAHGATGIVATCQMSEKEPDSKDPIGGGGGGGSDGDKSLTSNNNDAGWSSSSIASPGAAGAMGGSGVNESVLNVCRRGMACLNAHCCFVHGQPFADQTGHRLCAFQVVGTCHRKTCGYHHMTHLEPLNARQLLAVQAKVAASSNLDGAAKAAKPQLKPTRAKPVILTDQHNAALWGKRFTMQARTKQPTQLGPPTTDAKDANVAAYASKSPDATVAAHAQPSPRSDGSKSPDAKAATGDAEAGGVSAVESELVEYVTTVLIGADGYSMSIYELLKSTADEFATVNRLGQFLKKYPKIFAINRQTISLTAQMQQVVHSALARNAENRS